MNKDELVERLYKYIDEETNDEKKYKELSDELKNLGYSELGDIAEKLRYDEYKHRHILSFIISVLTGKIARGYTETTDIASYIDGVSEYEALINEAIEEQQELSNIYIKLWNRFKNVDRALAFVFRALYDANSASTRMLYAIQSILKRRR